MLSLTMASRAFSGLRTAVIVRYARLSHDRDKLSLTAGIMATGSSGAEVTVPIAASEDVLEEMVRSEKNGLKPHDLLACQIPS